MVVVVGGGGGGGVGRWWCGLSGAPAPSPFSRLK